MAALNEMQQIIKQAGPSKQLFETLNFGLMKVFNLLIKNQFSLDFIVQ